MTSIFIQNTGRVEQDSTHLKKQFEQLNKQAQKLREIHVKDLRPNLSHPDNEEELEDLNKREETRKISQMASINKFREDMRNLYFEEGNKFYVRALNNISFLLIFYDNWILHEDYV
jgi:hypothetical protein